MHNLSFDSLECGPEGLLPGLLHPDLGTGPANPSKAGQSKMGSSGFVDIKLDMSVPLLATITRKSLTTLKLHPDQRVHAQIKAVAFSHEALDSVAVE
ncbi:MAG: TOBE domain-containing protein [Nitrospirales bacterium]